MCEDARRNEQWLEDLIEEHQEATVYEGLGEKDEPALLKIKGRSIAHDFSGQNISKGVFTDCRFFNPNFSGTDLTKTVFRNCEFFSPIFSPDTVLVETMLCGTILGDNWTRPFKELAFRQIRRERDLGYQTITHFITGEEISFLYFESGMFAGFYSCFPGDEDGEQFKGPEIATHVVHLYNLFHLAKALGGRYFSDAEIEQQETILYNLIRQQERKRDENRLRSLADTLGFTVTAKNN